MDTKIGYKVVWKYQNGHCYSSSSIACKRYFLNRFVKRGKNNGPLCLFKTLKAAKKYRLNFKQFNFGVVLKIFKAEYIPSKDKALWYKDPFLNPVESPRIALKDLKKNFKEIFFGIGKDNTVLAEKVKLKEEVE